MADVTPTIVAQCHGIEVPDAPHFGPGMIKSMQDGRYERNEVRAGLAAIEPGARILELGAGSGIVGAVIAQNCKPDKMLSVEANPELIEHITRLYAHNQLSDVIEVRHGVVLTEPDPPSVIDFFLRGNFLGSALNVIKKPEKARKVQVPVMAYETLKAEFPHDVIVMDIEGAERAFFEHADLDGVHMVILEVHRQIYGREGMQDLRRSFDRNGLVLDEEHSLPGVRVYARS
ncbi:FkbM family methyltransferase [uncultured Roseobacter sp.]|uniref:FkbM family methyltransferase n=1 Tax=uncultured Roseobacter sp. TaxID=114847 RepID=UPI0026068AEC|nr:FkbM family methyltransferase [uncultured Roseobacter sp.]